MDIMDIPMPIPMDIMLLLALFIPYMVDIHTVIMPTLLALSMLSLEEKGARLRPNPRLILSLGIMDITVTLIDTDTTVDTMDLVTDTLDTTDIPMVMDITDGADR